MNPPLSSVVVPFFGFDPIKPQLGISPYHVNWNAKHVSDDALRTVLLRAAQLLRANVEVTSGDRDHALAVGGKTKSLHLQNRAVDFHMQPLSDEEVFGSLQKYAQNIFDSQEAYELIHHGVFTETTGAHVHLGHFPQGLKLSGIYCKVEGLTKAGRGLYPVINTVRLSS